MRFGIANKITNLSNLVDALRSFAVSARCLSHTQEHSKIIFKLKGWWRSKRSRVLEKTSIREGWRWESRYKRNNVYNVPFRRNSKFVSLSTIIFRNLHTNRFRGPCTRWNEGNASSFNSPFCTAFFTFILVLVLKATLRFDASFPHAFPSFRGCATLKFYPFRFRGWSIARSALVNVRKMTLRFHIFFFRVVERIYYVWRRALKFFIGSRVF